MKKKKRFNIEDLLGLYFSRAMSDDSTGSLLLFQHLLGLQKRDEYILSYDTSKIRELLSAQFEWLKEIDLSYYEDEVDILLSRFHRLTDSEIKNKQIWLAKIKKTHGDTVVVRPLTDIEKAFFGWG